MNGLRRSAPSPTINTRYTNISHRYPNRWQRCCITILSDRLPHKPPSLHLQSINSMFLLSEHTQELASPSLLVIKAVALPNPVDISRVEVALRLSLEVSTRDVDTVAMQVVDGTAVDPTVAAADVPRLLTTSQVDVVDLTARRVVIMSTVHSSPTL